MVWFDYYVCAYTNVGEKMKVEDSRHTRLWITSEVSDGT